MARVANIQALLLRIPEDIQAGLIRMLTDLRVELTNEMSERMARQDELIQALLLRAGLEDRDIAGLLEKSVADKAKAMEIQRLQREVEDDARRVDDAKTALDEKVKRLAALKKT